jgi:uncharacterized phage infection (PIP) family protein YhgE
MTISYNSAQVDQRRGVDLWLRTWILLGVVVALVVIAYLILISNSLAGINAHLGSAANSVSNVYGSAKTLPDQIQTVNQNLTAIDNSLKSIPADAEKIRANLTSVKDHGVAINTSLTSSNSQLAAVASDLSSSVPLLNTTASKLVDTSGLLRSILKSTSAIDTNLVAAKGNGPAGVLRINSTVESINGGLQPSLSDLNSILAGLGSINGHLTGVCNSAAVSALRLLHGGTC